LQPKANYAERALKTIKGRLMRYFSHKRTARWVDVLPQITDSYNNTWHRTIKRKPSSVTIENASQVWATQYAGEPVKPDGAFKYQIGDYVRISHIRHLFTREYSNQSYFTFILHLFYIYSTMFYIFSDGAEKSSKSRREE